MNGKTRNKLLCCSIQLSAVERCTCRKCLLFALRNIIRSHPSRFERRETWCLQRWWQDHIWQNSLVSVEWVVNLLIRMGLLQLASLFGEEVHRLGRICCCLEGRSSTCCCRCNTRALLRHVNRHLWERTGTDSQQGFHSFSVFWCGIFSSKKKKPIHKQRDLRNVLSFGWLNSLQRCGCDSKCLWHFTFAGSGPCTNINSFLQFLNLRPSVTWPSDFSVLSTGHCNTTLFVFNSRRIHHGLRKLARLVHVFSRRRCFFRQNQYFFLTF